MNATQLFAFTLLTAVAGAAFASEESSTLQRGQIKADVVHARQDGSLLPAGEGAGTPCGQYVYSSGPTTLSRETVVAEVARARVDGTLMPAGAALWGSHAMYNARPSTLARADVKAQVLQARLDGTLIPAGEAYAFSGPRAVGGTALAQARIGR